MVFRKLPLIILLLAGLFAFQGPIESSRLPQVAQTELVMRAHGSVQVVNVRAVPSEAVKYFVCNEPVPTSIHQQAFYQSLLIDSQHHHSTL